jgi:hypothetical protein
MHFTGKIMQKICHMCDNDFDDIGCFCSDKCRQEYWKNPQKVTISTKCPSCQQSFSRTVFSMEVAPYQGLVLCPVCEEKPVEICLTKKYDFTK